MSGIEGTNQPLTCKFASYCDAFGSIAVEKAMFEPVYSGN